MLSNKIVLLASSMGTNNAKTIDEITQNSESKYGFGDIFKIFDWSITEGWKRMNDSLIKLYASVPYLTVIICLLIFTILALLLLRIYGLGNGITYKAIDRELENFNRMKKRDRSLIWRRKVVTKLINRVESIGLGMGTAKAEYMSYNLKRAGIMASGGQKIMEPQEYNALIRLSQGICLIFGLLVMLNNSILGVGIILVGCALIGKIPEYLIRQTVIRKDAEIKKGFFKFYGDIHYNIIRNSPTALKTTVRNYAKMELSPAMEEFVNNIADLFDLYGEFEGSKYVALEYREIPDVGKLMRLIQQYYDGADVENDMKGFRQTLMLAKQMEMDRQGEKVEAFCRKALIIVLIILVQLVISTLLNTMPDLMNFGGIF